MSEELHEAVSGYLLDGMGSCCALSREEVERWVPGDGVLWIHVDRGSESGQAWLRNTSGLPEIVCDALLRDDVRPRALVVGKGLLAVLRSVNLNDGESPEDMVALRLWVEGERIIDLRHHKLRAVSDVRDQLTHGLGPRTSGDLLVALAETMVDRTEPVVDRLEDEIEELEEEMRSDTSSDIREKLGSIRRRTIRLRRYVAPQRDALTRLRVENVAWMTSKHAERLHEIVDRITHIIEDLDCVREHAGVAQDELASLQSEAVNQNMYRLSIVAAVFLPPTLIAGLLGANVSGIPWSDRAFAFEIVCVLLLAITLFELWLLRRFGWI